MARRWASVSVDLDSLPHYLRIHGLSEAALAGADQDLVYRVGLSRFERLFAAHRVRPTWFAIGEDLEREPAVVALAEQARRGAEIASHSYRHDYHLARLSPAEIEADLVLAERRIEAVTNTRPVGFRAPGYTLSPALLHVLEAQGYAYDSSAFPSAPYYLAKASVMGALALGGRPSRSVLDTPRVLGAPRRPYHPALDRPYQRGSGRIVELPITVSRWARLPFIGTLVTTAPSWVTRTIYRTLRAERFVNFELHGVDLLDESDGIPEVLSRRQRDLLVPWALKAERLEAVLRWLSTDFELAPLCEVAHQVG